MHGEIDAGEAGIATRGWTFGGELKQLSDAELLASTRRVVGRSNLLLASLLAHLAEVDARGIHRTRACSTLCAYCIYELRLSEDAASRRVAASRLVRKFPVLVNVVARGELHLTGLLMLGPHFTPENLGEVLARGRFRTKRELTRLVRELDPLPDVPGRIEPLGPAPAQNPSTHPSWQDVMWALYPVRNLPSGERPCDWAAGGDDVVGTEQPPDHVAGIRGDDFSASIESLTDPRPDESIESPVRTELGKGPQRYLVQFTADDQYAALVERAKALLSHAGRRLDLAEVHSRAMHTFVDGLEKRRFGAPRQRGRNVPAAVRREVFERDGARCTFVDDTGQRCRETHLLEIHHLKPFAQGGQHTAANLTIYCKAHNTLAAEEAFGRAQIQNQKSA